MTFQKDNLPVIISIVAVVAIIAVVGVVAYTSSNTTTSSSSSSSSVSSVSSAAVSKNIVDGASKTPTLSTLVTAVTAAGLVETLSAPGPFTVFAPTNDAFNKLPAGTLADLLKPENKTKLSNILTYHVVSGKVLAKDLTDGQVVKTVNGASLKVVFKNGVPTINGATIEAADVIQGNGVVHVINAVLLP